MPRLDAWGKVSLLGRGKLVSVVCNDVEVLRTALSCSMQTFIQVTEERVARLTEGTPTGSHIGEAVCFKPGCAYARPSCAADTCVLPVLLIFSSALTSNS